MLKTEAQGFANKVLVASELKLENVKSSGIKKLMDLYSSGKITKEQLISTVEKSISKATTTDEKGNKIPAAENYRLQGESLRQEELKKENKKKQKI